MEKSLKLLKCPLSQSTKICFYQGPFQGPAAYPVRKSLISRTSSCADAGMSYLEGLPSCKHCQHPQSWWQNHACSEAAYGAWLPDKMHFLQLKKTSHYN